MTELFDVSADVCLISALAAGSENFADVLLPAFCSLSNAEGGIVIIGAARAADGSFIAEGLPSIPETQSSVDELISDKSKISSNTIKNVNKIRRNGKNLLKIEVAPAPWTERPVFINSDPIHGAYRYSKGEIILIREKFIMTAAKDSLDMQRDNKRTQHFHESRIDIKALERYRKIHKEKHPFSKWELLDNESFMGRIGAQSEGYLLKAGLLMFGDNNDVSFCLRRKDDGAEVILNAKNIWSFTELLLPLFDRYYDIECRNALAEAFFNSVIHADYSFGNVEAVIEKHQVTFINSGIPRSTDGSSVCANLRIMRMLCLVGYAQNEGMGMGLINNYSQNLKLSVDYEKWRTLITIPANMSTETQKAAQEKIDDNLRIKRKIRPATPAPLGFYPVVELAKRENVSDNITFDDTEHIIISIPDDEEEEKPVTDSEESDRLEEPEEIDEAEGTDETEEIEETGKIEETEEFDKTEDIDPEIIREIEKGNLPHLKESEQGILLEQAVREYRLKTAVNQETDNLIDDVIQNIDDVTQDIDDVTQDIDDVRQDMDDVKQDAEEPEETDEEVEAVKVIDTQREVKILNREVKKKPRLKRNTEKAKHLSVVMGNLIIEDETDSGESDILFDAAKMVRENSHASSAMIKDALLEYCGEFRTIGEISAALLRPESSLKRHINRLIKDGKLEKNENNAYRTISGMEGDID